MISNRTRQPVHATFLIALLSTLLTLVFFAPTLAGEAHPDPSLTQKSFVHQSKGLILESIDEDSFIIDGDQYLFTGQTRLLHSNRRHQRKRLKPGDIITPCRVDIVYRQYSTTTEGVPFEPWTKILEKVTIIQELAPETLKKDSTRSKKTRR